MNDFFFDGAENPLNFEDIIFVTEWSNQTIAQLSLFACWVDRLTARGIKYIRRIDGIMYISTGDEHFCDDHLDYYMQHFKTMEFDIEDGRLYNFDPGRLRLSVEFCEGLLESKHFKLVDLLGQLRVKPKEV